MTGPTPGPWKWEYGMYLVGADGTRVCDDGSADGEYSERLEPESANGRLIAAAPDLLAVAQAIIDFSCHDDYGHWSEREFTKRLNSITEQARAAIEKATT